MVSGQQHFILTFCCHLQVIKWKRVLPKCHSPPTKQHGGITKGDHRINLRHQKNWNLANRDFSGQCYGIIPHVTKCNIQWVEFFLHITHSSQLLLWTSKLLLICMYILCVLLEERTNNNIHDTYIIFEDLYCLYCGCI